MSTKITNNLKVHGESTTQKYTDSQYNSDTQRLNGAQPGTPISSKLMNTGLRNATLVTSALIEALKTVVPNDNDLTATITVGANTTHAALVTALTEALVKIKVEHATTADNVISGALVEETTTARESKQGFGISLGLNSKLHFKTTWAGTHKNNDVLYYPTAGDSKGFYIVKGLSVETKTQAAGTLTIASGQTPSTHSTNLQRLTFETTISTNTGLSKTDTVSSTSTTNQLITAKGVYDYTQAKLVKHTAAGIKILTRGTTDGVLSDLDKVTTISTSSTDSQIPTAKSIYDYTQAKLASHTSAGVKILTRSTTDGVYHDLDKVTSVNSSSTDSQIPTAKTLHDSFQTKISKHTTAGSKILSRATTDGALSDLDKSTTMPATPTNSEIPTTKLLKDYAQPIISAGSANDILIKSTTAGVLSTLTKVTSVSSTRTDSDIPTAKAVYTSVESAKSDIENRKWELVRNTTSWTTISTISDVNGTPTLIPCSPSGAFSVGDVLAFELAISSYTDRPFIVQSVLTLNSTNPDTGNIFKAEGLTTYDEKAGGQNTYTEVRHYTKFSYSSGTNLRFKTVGLHSTQNMHPTARAFAINYIKDDYDNASQNVKSSGSDYALVIKRIWRIR